MDTKFLENIAEDLFAHILQRGGLLVAKPKFDREGTDLIALIEVADGAKFCRIQCKGRTLIKSGKTTIQIPKEYVTGAFFVFIYIDAGNKGQFIFCFSREEIIHYWELKTSTKSQKQFYSLYISKSTFVNSNKDSNLLEFIFTDERIDQIKEIIRKSFTENEIKLLGLLKQQRFLIEKKEKAHQLEQLIKDIKYTNAVLKANTKNFSLLNDRYKKELSKWGDKLPRDLIKKISKLLQKNIPVVKILTQVRDFIPENVPESVLEDYISQMKKRS